MSSSRRSPRAPSPPVGDAVIGSDRRKIGEVEEVVTPDGDTPGYLRVPRGLIMEKETFIPVDAATHRADGQVYIDLPQLVVGKVPWTEPPSTEDLPMKYGTRRADVRRLCHGHEPTGLRS
jgi:ureidoacrylate peracid hydrolase